MSPFHNSTQNINEIIIVSLLKHQLHVASPQLIQTRVHQINPKLIYKAMYKNNRGIIYRRLFSQENHHAIKHKIRMHTCMQNKTTTKLLYSAITRKTFYKLAVLYINKHQKTNN